MHKFIDNAYILHTSTFYDKISQTDPQTEGLILNLRVEELRQLHKFTLAELAKESGVSKTTLSEIKLGLKTTLNRDQEKRLANAFSIEISELYKED